MFTRLIARFGFAIGCLLALLLLLALCSISWLLTCGLVYLITLCFELAFSWAWATGVWLILWLLGSIFNK